MALCEYTCRVKDHSLSDLDGFGSVVAPTPPYRRLGSCGSSGLVKNRCCSGSVSYAKDEERRIRARLDARVGVLDVYVVFTEP